MKSLETLVDETPFDADESFRPDARLRDALDCYRQLWVERCDWGACIASQLMKCARIRGYRNPEDGSLDEECLLLIYRRWTWIDEDQILHLPIKLFYNVEWHCVEVPFLLRKETPPSLGDHGWIEADVVDEARVLASDPTTPDQVRSALRGFLLDFLPDYLEELFEENEENDVDSSSDWDPIVKELHLEWKDRGERRGKNPRSVQTKGLQ